MWSRYDFVLPQRTQVESVGFRENCLACWRVIGLVYNKVVASPRLTENAWSDMLAIDVLLLGNRDSQLSFEIELDHFETSWIHLTVNNKLEGTVALDHREKQKHYLRGILRNIGQAMKTPNAEERLHLLVLKFSERECKQRKVGAQPQKDWCKKQKTDLHVSPTLHILTNFAGVSQHNCSEADQRYPIWLFKCTSVWNKCIFSVPNSCWSM